MSAAARRYRRPKPPPPPKPSSFARLHDRAWRTLERAGEVFTPADGTGRLTGWCPVCRDGLLALRVIDGEEPFIRQDGCTAGCTHEQIAEALG